MSEAWCYLLHHVLARSTLPSTAVKPIEVATVADTGLIMNQHLLCNYMLQKLLLLLLS